MTDKTPAVPHLSDLFTPRQSVVPKASLPSGRRRVAKGIPYVPTATLATASWTDGRKATVSRVRNSPHVVLRLEQAGRAMEISYVFTSDTEALNYANTDPLAWRF